MRAIIDRFEEDKAVLLYGDDEEYKVIFPRKYLPSEADEGAVININFEYDAAATEAELQKSMELLKELQGD